MTRKPWALRAFQSTGAATPYGPSETNNPHNRLNANEKPRLKKGGVSRSWTAAESLLFDLVLLGDALELRQDPGVERVRRGARDLPYGKFSVTMALASETVEPDVP